MSAIAELRTATWSSHQRLEKRLDVRARFSSLDAYRRHLEQMWGFCAMLESRVAVFLKRDLADFDSRRKSPLLRRDLIVLGASPACIEALPQTPDLPACAETAQAFGCMYVLEGATLGGRTLLPVVESRLGLTAAHGAAFLASYGETVVSMWRSFGAALDAWCATPERSERAAATAVATFDSLERWLCGDTQSSGRRSLG